MKIVIDVSPLKTAHKDRGIGSYTRSLIDALRRVDGESEYVLTSKPGQVKADLVHYPFFDFYFLTLPLFKPGPTVVTIHDTIPLVFPQYYPPGVRGTLKFLLQQVSLKTVRGVITDSMCSKKDITSYLHIPPEKIHAIPLAADHEFYPSPSSEKLKVLKSLGIYNDYFLYVGDVNYNKNIEGLLKAFSLSNVDMDLVLVSKAMGKRTPQAQTLNQLIEELKLEKRVHCLTNIQSDPKSILRALYSGAFFYIQPSFYEGFGLPVLEAAACKTPVMTSRGGSLAEITPLKQWSFNPHNIDQMRDMISQSSLLANDTRNDLAAQCYQFGKNFTWDKTAQKTLEVYRSVSSQ